MRPVALLGVLLLAKFFVFVGRDVTWSWWGGIAILSQDLLVVLAFALLDLAFRARAWVGWVIYTAIAAWTIVNVPVWRMMAGPLTPAMMRGAGGALADSILHHVTVFNLAAVALLAAAAAMLPLLTRRLPRHALATAAVVGCVLVLLGPLAMRRTDTGGAHRNAVVTLLTSARARIIASAGPAGTDWRRAFEGNDGTDLTHLRGAAGGRNVVLVILESTGARYLGLHGASRDPMPNLSKLAQSAVVFDDAYTVYPESIKGLFATLCSRYPAMDTRPEAYAAVRTPSIADVLAGHGYRTALFHSGRFAYLGMRSLIEGRGFQVLEDAGDVGGRRDSSFGVDEESTVARALGWVDSLDAGQRFFLTYMPIAGHHPYESPAGGPWPETSEENCYLNALHYADRALGLLVDGLQKRGRLDQTLFIVFGDHGEAFEQHDGNFGHTNSVYEENVRIPYIIAMPGRLTSQVRSRTIAGTIDTPPTIIDLLGFDPPADWQGRSLLEGDARMALFFTDYANALVGARDGRWKFIHSPETDRSMLFDLVTDPAEMSNLAAREPRRVNRYRDRALRWAQAQRAMVVRSSH